MKEALLTTNIYPNPFTAQDIIIKRMRLLLLKQIIFHRVHLVTQAAFSHPNSYPAGATAGRTALSAEAEGFTTMPLASKRVTCMCNSAVFVYSRYSLLGLGSTCSLLIPVCPDGLGLVLGFLNLSFIVYSTGPLVS